MTAADRQVLLRAVDVDPAEALAAGGDIAIDGGATDPAAAAETFLHGLEIGLRLRVEGER